METTINTQIRRTPWNKGRLIGQRPPLKQKEVWAIRIRLQLAHEVRDLALFNLAIDSKLRGCDLVKLESAQNRGRLRSRAYRPILAGLSTDRELAMKLIIEARLEDDGVELTNIPIPVAVIHRHNDDLEQLGLSLAEGRDLLAATQSALVSSQASVWVSTQDYCHECYTPLRRKDSRSIVMRTVFGKVKMSSPRFWCCDCEPRQWQERTISPLAQALPKRVTPELEYLQTKWAAHLPYAAATAMLKEVLPVQNCISASGTRHRICTASNEIEIRVKQQIARLPLLGNAEDPKNALK